MWHEKYRQMSPKTIRVEKYSGDRIGHYLRRAGAILLVRVPATIMQSDCRGLGRKMTPKRSKSYRAAPVCIISTAQHASPKVIGQIDPRRAQFSRSSTLDITYSTAFGRPAGDDVDGGGGRAYGAGDVAAEEYGRADWIGAALCAAVRASRAVLGSRAIEIQRRRPKAWRNTGRSVELSGPPPQMLYTHRQRIWSGQKP